MEINVTQLFEDLSTVFNSVIYGFSVGVSKKIQNSKLIQT